MIIKMYSVFARETLKLMKFEGKLAAQAQHATLHAWWDAEDRLKYDRLKTDSGRPIKVLSAYYQDVMHPYKYLGDARKITLVVDTVDELRELYKQFRPHMGVTLVEDCAYTVFEESTVTAVGLGPIPSDWTKGTRLADLPTLGNEIQK